DTVANAVEGGATVGAVTNAGVGSPNLLLWADPGTVVLPPPPPPTSIMLTAKGTKVKGVNTTALSWSGTSTSVDVWRGTSKVTTVAGSSFTETLGKGSRSYTYKVCVTTTTTCSNTVVVTF
ncbi:MAG: alkaline serine protease, partial [Acidimicrobiia bacterium]